MIQMFRECQSSRAENDDLCNATALLSKINCFQFDQNISRVHFLIWSFGMKGCSLNRWKQSRIAKVSCGLEIWDGVPFPSTLNMRRDV